MNVYVGIDPGIIRVGIAVISEENSILYLDAIDDDATVKAKRLDSVRLASITNRTQQSLEGARLPNTTTFAIEQPFVGQFKTKSGMPTANQGALKTYGVFSILMNACQERVDSGRATKLLVVAPPTLKAFLRQKKYPVSTKEEVAAVVKARWGFEHESHDVTDAFALAQYAREQD